MNIFKIFQIKISKKNFQLFTTSVNAKYYSLIYLDNIKVMPSGCDLQAEKILNKLTMPDTIKRLLYKWRSGRGV